MRHPPPPFGGRELFRRSNDQIVDPIEFGLSFVVRVEAARDEDVAALVLEEDRPSLVRVACGLDLLEAATRPVRHDQPCTLHPRCRRYG